MTSKQSTTPQVQFLDISAAQAGQRIDNYLLTLEKGVPKSRIYRAIRKGEVRVNKGRIKQTYRIQEGDNIRIPPLRTAEKTEITTVSHSMTQQLNDSILLEDDDLLVLNKPPGLAVHAGTNVKQGVIEALRIIRSELPYLELVHRLDRDTSGVLLLAKSREALLNLQQQMINHDINKRYLTLVKGSWSDGEKLVEQPLKKNTVSSGERMVRVDAEGKYAKTTFIARETFAQAQLTEVILYTGRTHQIRVHCQCTGHPIASDTKYGHPEFDADMKSKGLKRLFLHAASIEFTHPLTEQRLKIEAPLEPSLEKFLTQLKKAP